MGTYRVIWEIDLDADSAEEAAEKALEIQRDIHSTATSFTVVSMSNNDFSTDYIDFHEGDNNASKTH